MLKLTRISEFNGEPKYFITSSEKIKENGKIYSAVIGDEELFCNDTNVEGIYSFGCRQLTDGVFHGKGYVWSSRPGCINGEFGTKLIEANINGAGYWYIDIEVLKPLVEAYTGLSYDIQEYHAFYDKDFKEPIYKLVERV
jgi:hypothetical protein